MMNEDDEIGSCAADARDAARYRALAAATGDERIIVKLYECDDSDAVIGSIGLEILAETLIAEQAIDNSEWLK